MRDTLPSLFLSAAEKFGADADAPALALPLMPELELWPELEPEAAEPLEVLEGELDELAPLLLEGVCAEVEPLLDFSPAANEAPDSARSAAAVALTRTFTFMFAPQEREKGFADKQRAAQRKHRAGSPRYLGAPAPSGLAPLVPLAELDLVPDVPLTLPGPGTLPAGAGRRSFWMQRSRSAPCKRAQASGARCKIGGCGNWDPERMRVPGPSATTGEALSASSSAIKRRVMTACLQSACPQGPA